MKLSGQGFPVRGSASDKHSQPRFCWHGEVLVLSLSPAVHWHQHFPAQFQLAFTILTNAGEKRNAV